MEEQIKKFLEGKATETEEQAVLDYVAENDSHLCEMLEIADEYRRSVVGKRISRKKSVVWYSAAASVVGLLVVGGIWLLTGNTGDNNPQYAYNVHPTETEELSDINVPMNNNGGFFAQEKKDASHRVSEKDETRQEEIEEWSVVFSPMTVNSPNFRGNGTSRVASSRVSKDTKAVPVEDRFLDCKTSGDKWLDEYSITFESNAPVIAVRIMAKDGRVLFSREYQESGTVLFPVAARKEFKMWGDSIVCICSANYGDSKCIEKTFVLKN